MTDSAQTPVDADEESNLLFHIRPIEEPTSELLANRIIEVPSVGDIEGARVRKRILDELHRELTSVAHAMCKIKVDGQSHVNRPLKRALISAFSELDFYAVIMTSTPLNKDRRIKKQKHIQNEMSSTADRMTMAREQMVFALLWSPPDTAQKRFELPHKGRIIFYRDENGSLCIPHPDWDIPFAPLTRLNLARIGGVVGNRLRAAFEDGYKDILHKDGAPRRIKREKDLSEVDRRDIEEAEDNTDIAMIEAPDATDATEVAAVTDVKKDPADTHQTKGHAPSPRERKLKAEEEAFKRLHGIDDWGDASDLGETGKSETPAASEPKTERFARAAAEKERLRLARKQAEQSKAPYLQKEYFRLQAMRDIHGRIVTTAQANTEVALQAAIRKAAVASDLADDIKHRQRWIAREQEWIAEAPSRIAAKAEIAKSAAELARRVQSFDEKAAKRFKATSERNALRAEEIATELALRKKVLAERLLNEEKWLLDAPTQLAQKRKKSFQAAQKLVEVQQRLIEAEALAQKASDNFQAHIARHGVAKPLQKEHQLQSIWKEASQAVFKEKQRSVGVNVPAQKTVPKPALSQETFSPSTFLQRATLRDVHGRAPKRRQTPVAKAWWLKHAGRPMPKR